MRDLGAIKNRSKGEQGSLMQVWGRLFLQYQARKREDVQKLNVKGLDACMGPVS